MTKKGASARRSQIPVDYIVADPNGNRRSRRMAAKEAKANARGRDTGTSTGGAFWKPLVDGEPEEHQP